MKTNITLSVILLSVSLLTLTAIPSHAQLRSDINKNTQADTLKDSFTNLRYLLNPSMNNLALEPTYNGSLNPFTKNKSGRDYALLGIASSMVKGHLRGPIYSPNYGPGTPPPFFLMEPLNVTDYKQQIESFKRLSNDSY